MPLRRRPRLALSAGIILAAIKASSEQLLEAGGVAVTTAVSHKYGPTASENVALAGRTMRNVVLVYVDVHGLSHRAIVKHTAALVKERVARAREN